ncbi:hypothetical protein BIY20_11605 [Vibrio panuliri]|uniref:Uncharacterized protein n=1 Tax=Vibrio panuliri TaxID=1381081 RepID=A0ABX3FG93_9VIBR|nr:hypothetical protein BIY20_11605 [Vibrio panuliri]
MTLPGNSNWQTLILKNQSLAVFQRYCVDIFALILIRFLLSAPIQQYLFLNALPDLVVESATYSTVAIDSSIE